MSDVAKHVHSYSMTTFIARLARFTFLTAAAGLVSLPVGAAPFQWTTTGPLNVARTDQAAAPLADGRALVVGGENRNFVVIGSAEVYDPATGNWTLTGSLHTARRNASATFLPNGLVRVAGGVDDIGNPSTTAELYDATSGAWTTTGSLHTGRFLHIAT